MEVKEAIEELQNVYGMPYTTVSLVENETIHKIISLLQQGEADSKELKITKEELKKVWQMWEELYKGYGMCFIRKNDNEGFMSNILYKLLEDLQQKYFPKNKETNEKG